MVILQLPFYSRVDVGVVRQIIAGALCTFLMLDNGLHEGWSTPMIQKMMGGDDPIQVTSNQSAWVINYLALGGITGPILALYLMDKIGRKWSIICAALPKTSSWLCFALANDYRMLYLGRFFAGLGSGISLCVIPIYIGEVTDKRTRGPLSTFIALMNNIGILIAYVSGLYLSRVSISIFCIWIPTVFLFLFIWMPESPVYLRKVHKVARAESVLRWTLGKEDISQEMDEIEKIVSNEPANCINNVYDSVKELVQRRGTRKAFRIIILLFTALTFSGIQAILSYQQNIYSQAGMDISTNINVIITGVAIVFAGVICVSLVKLTGKRKLLLISAPATAGCLLVLAIFFLLQSLGVDVTVVNWIPMVSVILYVIAYGVGLDSIAYSYQGEIFPDSIKSFAAMFCALYYSFLSMLIIKIYQELSDAFGIHAPLWIFIVSTLINWLLIYVIIPETEGKSLSQIQKQLHEEKTTTKVLKKTASYIFS